jgi:predicted nucleic acid-binding protein
VIVVDASVAVKWVVPGEEHASEALALLTATTEADELILAPTLLPFEVANVIHKLVRRGVIDAARGRIFLDRFLALPIELAAPLGFHRRALALAGEFDLPAAYDAHYLALAEFAGCDVWTDDRRLLRQVGGRFPALRWIGELLA